MIISHVLLEVKIVQDSNGSKEDTKVHVTFDWAAIEPVKLDGCTENATYYDSVPRHVYILERETGKKHDVIIPIPRYRCGNRIERVLPLGVLPNKRYIADTIAECILLQIKEALNDEPEEDNAVKESREEKAYAANNAFHPCLETMSLWTIWFLQNIPNFHGPVLRFFTEMHLLRPDNEAFTQFLDALKYEDAVTIELRTHRDSFLQRSVRNAYMYGGRLAPYYGTNRGEEYIRGLLSNLHPRFISLLYN